VAPSHHLSDTGLAQERTVLAWNRSGLDAVVCVAVLLRHTWPLHHADRAIAVGVTTTAAVVWPLALSSLTTRATAVSQYPRLGPRTIHLIGAATLTLAVVALLLSLLAPS
jgi:hypothetical protein